MSAEYQQLLTATIDYLERLRRQGTRHIAVDSSALALLRESPNAGAGRSGSRAVAKPAAPAALPQPGARAPEVSSRSGPSASSLSAAVPPARPVVPAIAPVIPARLDALPPLDPAAREAAMSELRERALNCQKCPHLVRSRSQVVFGVGDIHSTLMFVGEAPGADEDKEGEPFMGEAGQKLTRIIEAMGFSRETVYIANVLKCRPDTPGEVSDNRKPTAEEMKTCLPYLLAQVDIIRPKVIVALGATAMEGLLGVKKAMIAQVRGKWQEFRGTPLMPTYHPSYLLRNPAMMIKRALWEDMLQVMEHLSLPVSAKQRGYFLKG